MRHAPVAAAVGGVVEVERLAGEHRQSAEVTDLAEGVRPHLLAEAPMATGPLRFMCVGIAANASVTAVLTLLAV
jgi:hypothetical protein